MSPCLESFRRRFEFWVRNWIIGKYFSHSLHVIITFISFILSHRKSSCLICLYLLIFTRLINMVFLIHNFRCLYSLAKVPQFLMIPKSCLDISIHQVPAKPKTFISCARICKILCLPYTSILSMEIGTRKSLFFLVVGKLAHFKKAPVVYSMTCQILFITTLLI